MLPDIRRLTHSLVFRIVVMGVAFLMAGTVLRYVLASSVLREGVQANAAQQQTSLAQYVAQDIDAKVNARLHYLEDTAARLPSALLQQPLELQNWLARRHATNPLFSLGLVAIPIDGNGVIAEYPVVEGRKQLNFVERDWFMGARNSGKAVIGKPVVGRAANQPVVQMATPLRDGSGRMTGILLGVTALGAPGFLDIIQNHKVGEAGTFILFSPGHKLIVTATDPQMRLRALPEAGINKLLDQAMTGWRGTGITVNSQGIEDLAAFVSVPGPQWVVVARIPTSEIYASINAMQRQNLRLSLIAGAVLTLLLGWMTVWMLKPLKESARQMRAMAVGSTGLAPLPVVRSDEVGEMVESFNLLIEQLKKAESTLAYAAHHDALTGLPNRRFVLSQIRQSVALAIRQKASLALLFIDLDGFKAVNDRHGHKAGDMLLQQVAQRLRESVRASDLVGRLGGDEFLVLLTDCDDPANATASAEKTIALLSAPYLLDTVTEVIGASIGVALLPLHAGTAEGLVNAADDAMYVAKRERRGSCRMATTGYVTPATS